MLYLITPMAPFNHGARNVWRVIARSGCSLLPRYRSQRCAISLVKVPPKSRFHPTCRAMNSNVAQEDTIFALSSGAGVKSGVSVIRISGPKAPDLLKALTPSKQLPKPRVASLRRLYSPSSNELLDQAITVLFPKPKSFTGEDVAELHVHGSRAVVSGVLRALTDLGGRPAERGEFTRRAFENGRMDLTEVEGLADLIAAETSRQRRQALDQMGGGLRTFYEEWREKLKRCLARAEACIDFGEEVDIAEFDQILPVISGIRKEMKHHLEDRKRGEIIRDGAKVAIVGPPNVGKSTLFNILAKREAAIVSPIAGTTRDVLEIHLDLNGIPVTVCDTAGLRNATNDLIEQEGMTRARGVASNADLTLLLQDASTLNERCILKKTEPQNFYLKNNGNIITVLNKVDLIPERPLDDPHVFKTSLIKGRGVNDLLLEIERRLRVLLEGGEPEKGTNGVGKPDSMPVITRERHRSHVTAALHALDAFTIGRTKKDPRHLLPLDLATEELRVATREIGAITGIVYVEEVLDVLFSEFCIGK